MLLATVSSAKGQNKGACHRTTQPNPTSPPTPRLPPQRSPSPFFFFALLLSLRMLHLYHQPPYLPSTRSSISPSLLLSLSLLLFDYFRFAFLSFLRLSPPLSPSLFLCSSLNYWKQNGLKTKTQADVAWLITARRVWHPCQMKTVEKNYYCGRYVTPPLSAIFLTNSPPYRFNRFKSAKPLYPSIIKYLLRRNAKRFIPFIYFLVSLFLYSPSFPSYDFSMENSSTREK